MKRLLILPFVLAPSIAQAAYLDVPCPPPQPNEPPGCKVITLTPFEQNALLGNNMILDTARQGRPLDLGNAADYFRKKVMDAPAGKTFEVKPPEESKSEPGKPAIHLPPAKK
jgi:hypothetical protein